MNKKIIRLLSLMLAVFLCLSAVGCGKGKEAGNTASDNGGELDMADLDDIEISLDGTVSDDGTSGGSGGSKNPVKEIDAKDRLSVFDNIPKKLRGTSVTFAHWGDEGGEEYVKVAKEFTKLTGINVKWELYSERKYAADIAIKVASNKGPDIIVLCDSIPQIFKVAQPLTSIFDINDGFWDPRVTKATSFNGKAYFVNSYYSPYAPTTPIVVYNKKIFNDNGLTSPVDYINQNNWTWETFKQCMLDAKKLGFYGGVLDPRDMALTMGPVFMTYNSAAGRVERVKNNDAILKSMKFFAECKAEGLVGNYYIAQWPAGNIAMLTTDHYALKRNGYLKDMKASDYGAVKMPTSYGGVPCNYSGSSCRAYGIAQKAKNVEGAYYFLRYFLDVDNCNNVTNIFGNKEMQKFYTQEVLANYKNQNYNMSILKGPLLLVNHEWPHTDSFKELYSSSSEQMAVALSKVDNVFDGAVTESNKVLDGLK